MQKQRFSRLILISLFVLAGLVTGGNSTWAQSSYYTNWGASPADVKAWEKGELTGEERGELTAEAPEAAYYKTHGLLAYMNDMYGHKCIAYYIFYDDCLAEVQYMILSQLNEKPEMLYTEALSVFNAAVKKQMPQARYVLAPPVDFQKLFFPEDEPTFLYLLDDDTFGWGAIDMIDAESYGISIFFYDISSPLYVSHKESFAEMWQNTGEIYERGDFRTGETELFNSQK